MPELLGIPWTGWTAYSLLGLTFLFILLGILVPAKYYHKALKDAQEWKEAFKESEKARLEQAALIPPLLEQAKATHDIVKALSEVLTNARTGGTHVVPTSGK